MTAVIRTAREDDRDALVEQFLALNRYEEPIAGNRRTDRDGAVACLDAALARVAEAGGATLVAERDGRVVGHAVVVFETDAPFVREELRPYACVTELFVREELRGRGIGTALLEAAEAVAAARGLRRLTIGVLAGNARTAALYARLGFTPHAVEMEKPVRGADGGRPPPAD